MRHRQRPSIIMQAVGLMVLVGLIIAAPSPAGASAVANGPLTATLTHSYDLIQEPEAWFDRITVADGLSFPAVRSVIQDHQGYMWFGTDSGLNRYDGYQFTVYRNDPGDPSSLRFDDVWVVYEDSDGMLWVGGGGGLDRFDRSAGAFEHIDTRGQVFSIHEDSDGMLWVGFWHGLYGFDRTTGIVQVSFQRDPNALVEARMPSDNAILTIHEDHNGLLWIGTNSGLDRLDRTNGTFTHFRHDPDDPSSLSHNTVLAISEGRHGELWIGTGGGLDKLALRDSGDPGLATEGLIQRQHLLAVSEDTAGEPVVSICSDSADNLWIGTTGGLVQIGPDRDQIARHQHDPGDTRSLGEDTVTSIYQDRSGVLWIATLNGLSKYNRRASQFSHIREGPAQVPGAPVSSSLGLSGDKVWALYEDRDGDLWIGTAEGGLNRLISDTAGGRDREYTSVTVYQHDPDDPSTLSSNGVGAVYQDRSGAIWVGTGGGWLDRFDPQSETFAHVRYLAGSTVRAMVEDPAGNLWLGTDGEGLYRLDSERDTLTHFVQHWRQADHWRYYGSLTSHVVTSLVLDARGALWVGTRYGGINIWNESLARFDHYRHEPEDPESLSHRSVLSLYQDPTDQDLVWIGTLGGGLNRLDQASQTFTRYTIQDGLPDDTVGCIAADTAGFLWLSTPKGVSRFDPQSGAFRNYDQRDGLLVSAFAPGTCLMSRSGEMIVGGIGGVERFYPEQIEYNDHIPPIVITALVQGDEPARTDISPDEHIRMSYQDGFISFEFAALDYTAQEKNQYAYMMEGLDGAWVSAGTRRRAEYRNMRPGEYTFRAIGSNNDGVWNQEGTAVTITITPPIWETWWFRVIAVLALISLAVGGYRLRVRGIEERSRQLEHQVQERTSEIERRRRVAAGLRDVLEVLNSDRPLDQVLDFIARQTCQLLGASAAIIHHVDFVKGQVSVQAAHGVSPAMDRSPQPTRIFRGRADQAVFNGQPYAISDLEAYLAVLNTPEGASLEPEEIEWRRAMAASDLELLPGGAFLALPLTMGDSVYGSVATYYREPRQFSQEEIELGLSLANQAALAIENAQLYEQAQELAAVEERQRLARDLHDAVTQTLFSASLIAEALPEIWQAQPAQGQQLLGKLRQLSRGALAEMRTLLLELRPASLTEASLRDLLRQLGQAVSGREGIPVSISVEDPGELPADVHLVVYRIAQETLNNVAKHASASRVEVSLRTVPLGPARVGAPGIELRIHDDGCGFDPTRVAADHLGLGIMRERAADIGAHLEIDSQPGKGTLVTLVWPAKGESA